MDDKLSKIIEEIKGLTVLELSQLVKALEQEFGVSAAAPVAMMAAAPGAAAGGAAEAAPVEKTTFDVVLTNAGQAKIPVIKIIREITGLGLKEAKDLVDGAPKSVKQGLNSEDAEKIKKQLTDAGATVELK